MKNESISRTYAEALIELAESKGQLDEVQEEVEFFRSLFGPDDGPRLFLESPSIEAHERQEVFEKVFRGKASDLTLNFLLLVVRRGRQAFFLEMLDGFKVLYEKKMGIVHANVTTATPLSAENREALRLKLEKNLGKRVVLDSLVDEKLLGGFVLRYSGMVVDGSLSNELSEMKTAARNFSLGSELVHEN